MPVIVLWERYYSQGKGGNDENSSEESKEEIGKEKILEWNMILVVLAAELLLCGFGHCSTRIL